MLFNPVIRKARFHVPGYAPQQMAEMAESLVLEAIRPRIRQAYDVNDSPAPALAEQYARRKQRWGKNPVRDWTLSGHTLSTLSVLSAGHNTATIGFVGVKANRRAFINNRVVRQFGVSPQDRAKLARIRTDRLPPAVRTLPAAA